MNAKREASFVVFPCIFIFFVSSGNTARRCSSFRVLFFLYLRFLVLTKTKRTVIQKLQLEAHAFSPRGWLVVPARLPVLFFSPFYFSLLYPFFSFPMSPFLLLPPTFSVPLPPSPLPPPPFSYPPPPPFPLSSPLPAPPPPSPLPFFPLSKENQD